MKVLPIGSVVRLNEVKRMIINRTPVHIDKT